MNENTIAKAKASVTAEEWRMRIETCRSSGMKVKDWCKENGITTGTYYFHLRKLRKGGLEESSIVALGQPKAVGNGEIQICAGDIQINLPASATPEQLRAAVLAVKAC